MDNNVDVTDDFEEPYTFDRQDSKPPPSTPPSAHSKHSTGKHKKKKGDDYEYEGYGGTYGLDLLKRIGVVNIQEKLDPTEANLKTEVNNKYDILSSQNHRLFSATEDTERCLRNCMGKNRPFTINLYNAYGQAIVVIQRKMNCSLCFWGGQISGSSVTVCLASDMKLLGEVQQSCNPCTPNYYILDGDGNRVMYIQGPCCSSVSACCFVCCNNPFRIYELGTGTQVGEIVKTFRFEERVSDATSYTLKFEPELSTALKTVIISSVFCIDFSFFESGSCFCAGCPLCAIFAIVCALAIVCGTIAALVINYG